MRAQWPQRRHGPPIRNRCKSTVDVFSIAFIVLRCGELEFLPCPCWGLWLIGGVAQTRLRCRRLSDGDGP